MSTAYTTLDARDAIVERVVTTWAGSEFSDVTLTGNNGPQAELDKIEKIVNYEIVFGESDQVTIGADPVDRTWGSIEFFFGCRAGKGTRALLSMQSFIKAELKATQLGSVKTLIPSPGRQHKAPGWVFETLYVPFYFDSSPVANTHS